MSDVDPFGAGVRPAGTAVVVLPPRGTAALPRRWSAACTRCGYVTRCTRRSEAAVDRACRHAQRDHEVEPWDLRVWWHPKAIELDGAMSR